MPSRCAGLAGGGLNTFAGAVNCLVPPGAGLPRWSTTAELPRQPALPFTVLGYSLRGAAA